MRAACSEASVWSGGLSVATCRRQSEESEGAGASQAVSQGHGSCPLLLLCEGPLCAEQALGNAER